MLCDGQGENPSPDPARGKKLYSNSRFPGLRVTQLHLEGQGGQGSGVGTSFLAKVAERAKAGRHEATHTSCRLG